MSGCGVSGCGVPLDACGGRSTGSGGLAPLKMTWGLVPVADRRGGLALERKRWGSILNSYN